MKAEHIIIGALSIGLVTVSIISYNNNKKLKKDIEDLKASKASTSSKLNDVANTVKTVGNDVKQIVDRVKTNM